jgi:hypothetical protein
MNLKVEDLGEIEIIFDTALGNDSWDYMEVGSIHKKQEAKNLERSTLQYVNV